MDAPIPRSGVASAPGAGVRPPAAATLLGAAGLAPALFAVALAWFAAPDLAAVGVQLGITYSALILSFLGGLWWGLASARAEPAGSWGLLGLAVLPSLVALGLLLLSAARPAVALAGLAGAILLTLPVDRLLSGVGLTPGWWMRLRLPLSVGLAAATLAVAAALTRGG